MSTYINIRHLHIGYKIISNQQLHIIMNMKEKTSFTYSRIIGYVNMASKTLSFTMI